MAGREREVIQRDIDATDGQIDRLVYDLYGLTDEEISVVEEATGACPFDSQSLAQGGEAPE